VESQHWSLRNPNYIGADLNGPEGVTVDAMGNLHIADTLNNRVLKILLSVDSSAASTDSPSLQKSLKSLKLFPKSWWYKHPGASSSPF
jgi:hypothetical protein